MVPEGVVLGRVEDLEQRRGRVAPVVGTQLVHLVEHDDRVHGPRFTQGPHQATGLRAHVGAAVPTDLGLVPDTSQCHTDEGAIEGARHRLAQRGLAHARGTDQGQDGPVASTTDGRQAPLRLQLANGQVLQDALFHVAQAIVVLVEDLRGGRHIQAVLGQLAPGKLQHGVQPRADPTLFGALLIGPLQLGDLPLHCLADSLG